MSRGRFVLLAVASVAAGLVPSLIFMVSSFLHGSLDGSYAFNILSNAGLLGPVFFFAGATVGTVAGMPFRRRHPMAPFWVALVLGVACAGALFALLVQVGFMTG